MTTNNTTGVKPMNEYSNLSELLNLGLPRKCALEDIQSGKVAYTLDDFRSELYESIQGSISDEQKALGFFQIIFVICQAVGSKGEEEGVNMLASAQGTVFSQMGTNVIMELAQGFQNEIEVFTAILMRLWHNYKEEGLSHDEIVEKINTHLQDVTSRNP